MLKSFSITNPQFLAQKLQELVEGNQVMHELQSTIDQLNDDITHVTSVKSQLEIELREYAENLKELEVKNKSAEVAFANIRFVTI